MPPPYPQRSLAAVSLSAVLFVTAFFAPAPAAAWCRASAETSANGACVANPTAPRLFWKRSCTAYGFNADFFAQIDGMNEREVRSAFQAGFDAWAAVDCDGRAAFFIEQRAGTTPTAASEYRRDGTNESVVVAIEGERWATLPDHSERAVAMTLMWHNRQTGEILDTDIELNLGAGEFADCVAGSCRAGIVDLQNTITHEAGHVLGLGHSTDVSATMTAQTVGTVDIQKRTLAPDDIEGYCALDLPEWQCSDTSCSCTEAPTTTGTRSSGCQVTTSDTGWMWILAAIALGRRGFRRRRALHGARPRMCLQRPR